MLLAGNPCSVRVAVSRSGGCRGSGAAQGGGSQESLLFQPSRQERRQAQAASGVLSLPDVAVPALCWCDTTVLLLDSAGSLWGAVNSPVPPVGHQILGRVESAGTGSDKKPQRAQRGFEWQREVAETPCTSQPGLQPKQQKAISCLMRDLSDEEGTGPLGTPAARRAELPQQRCGMWGSM